jgi:hypothetical protein
MSDTIKLNRDDGLVTVQQIIVISVLYNLYQWLSILSLRKEGVGVISETDLTNSVSN